ncbi:RNA-dependent RNA polymerase [Golden shiner toti-like virus 1]|nr:RNA-dependent RNA polymerase [Golden shiner toti-like virus 1]
MLSNVDFTEKVHLTIDSSENIVNLMRTEFTHLDDWETAIDYKTPIKLKALKPLEGWGLSGWGYGLRLALDVVSDDTAGVMFEVITSIHNRKLDPREVFKKISSEAKLGGVSFSSKWEEYVNWELLGGYQGLSESEMAAEVRKQVTIPAASSLMGKPVITRLEEILMPLKGTVKEETTFENFLLCRDLWAKGTSGYIGSKMKIGSTKLDIAIAADNDKIKLIASQPFQNRPFIKSEPGKARPVVNSNMSCYLAMEYLWIHIEPKLRRVFSQNLSMFDGVDEKGKLWAQMAAESTKLNEIHVPLDYSRFDSTISRDIVIRTCELLLDIANLDDNWKKEFMFRFKNQTVEIPGYGVVLWNNSVLSGWRFTALIDSLVNWAILKSAGGIASGVGIKVQGDDVKISFTTISRAEEVVENINRLGFEINPGKVFCSRKRDEYLRMVSQDGKTKGYVIRALPKIVFNAPQENSSVSWGEKTRGVVDKWVRVISRGGNRVRSEYWMMRDLCGLTGESKKLLKDWLSTPATVGGAGYFPDGNNWITLKVEVESISDRVRGLDPAEFWRKKVKQQLEEKSKFYSFGEVRLVGSRGSWVQVEGKGRRENVPSLRISREKRFDPFVNAKLEMAINDKDWEEVRSLIDNKLLFDELMKEVPRWILVDILSGKMKWVHPPTLINNKEITATICKQASALVYDKFRRYHGVRSKDVLLGFQLGAEQWIRGVANGLTNILQ